MKSDLTTNLHRQDNVNLTEVICFLCNEQVGSTTLLRTCIHDIDISMRKCAIQLEDTDVLAKLAPGDMVALEAKYHTKYLANLYNRASAATNSTSTNTDVNDCPNGIAFAELVIFMEYTQKE